MSGFVFSAIELCTNYARRNARLSPSQLETSMPQVDSVYISSVVWTIIILEVPVVVQKTAIDSVVWLKLLPILSTQMTQDLITGDSNLDLTKMTWMAVDTGLGLDTEDLTFDTEDLTFDSTQRTQNLDSDSTKIIQGGTRTRNRGLKTLTWPKLHKTRDSEWLKLKGPEHYW